MIAAPWYLLAGGIGLVILGYFVAGLSGSSGRGPRPITPRMRDQDIINSLNEQDALPPGAILSFLGYLLVFVSILWRLLRAFM